MFGLRRTFESVVEELVTGLRNGTVVLPQLSAASNDEGIRDSGQRIKVYLLAGPTRQLLQEMNISSATRGTKQLTIAVRRSEENELVVSVTDQDGNPLGEPQMVLVRESVSNSDQRSSRRRVHGLCPEHTVMENALK